MLENGLVRRPRGKNIFFVKTSGGEIAYNSPIDHKDVVQDTHDMTDRRKVLHQMNQIGIDVWDMESGVSTVQRLAVLVHHYRYFSIPEPLGREIALLSMIAQQGPDKFKRIDTEDEVHCLAEKRYLKQVRELTGITPQVTAHDGYVTVSICNRVWKGTLEDQVKIIQWLRDFDVDGYIPRHSYAYMIQKSSVGDRLFTAPIRPLPVRWAEKGGKFVRVRAMGEVDLAHVKGDVIPHLPYKGRFFSAPVEMWRYQRVFDDRLMTLLGGNGAPMNLSKKSPDTYSSHMDAYEALVGKKHDAIVLSLAEKLRVPVVVPGDGLGRFSRLWPFPCDSSDINISPFTHSRVKHRSIKDVINSDPDNCLVLMYVWYVLDLEDKRNLDLRARRGKPTLIIDTRPEIDIGRRVNNMVYEVGYPDLDLPYFEHDSVEKLHGIKFNENLLSLKNPVFEKDSIVGRYYHFMRPFFKPEGDPVKVSDTISTYLKDRQYCYHVGRNDPEVVPFSLTSRSMNQVIYYMTKDNANVVPHTLHREIIGDRIYFCSREIKQTRHFFSGYTSEGEYNIHVVFHERSPTVIFVAGMTYTSLEFDRILSRHPEFSCSDLVNREYIKLLDDKVKCLVSVFPHVLVGEG